MITKLVIYQLGSADMFLFYVFEPSRDEPRETRSRTHVERKLFILPALSDREISLDDHLARLGSRGVLAEEEKGSNIYLPVTSNPILSCAVLLDCCYYNPCPASLGTPVLLPRYYYPDIITPDSIPPQ